ncbi:MAG: guanylate kinase [Verrucomicrobia bacterium]|nr:guanylate kinase [Verrucomicrobiota bacterium]
MSPTQPAPVLFLISAPSGAGKTTVCEQLVASQPGLARAITCTTRPPRPGERDRVDYYFLSPAQFEAQVAAGDFLEHATVYGHRYGTLQREVFERLQAGADVLLNVDVQGAALIRRQAQAEARLGRSLVTVFLTPPSLDVLAARLRQRATDSAQVLTQRLAAARAELDHWQHFDYLVISTTIPEDFRRVQAIYVAEKQRQTRSQAPSF